MNAADTRAQARDMARRIREVRDQADRSMPDCPFDDFAMGELVKALDEALLNFEAIFPPAQTVRRNLKLIDGGIS